jgi:hypothetical protein
MNYIIGIIWLIGMCLTMGILIGCDTKVWEDFIDNSGGDEFGFVIILFLCVTLWPLFLVVSIGYKLSRRIF